MNPGGVASSHAFRRENRPGFARESAQHIISSGLPALDDLLPEGGWRKGTIIEILSATNDDSALNLVLPALATLSRGKKWLAWIAPPHFLGRYQLASAGIVLSQVLLVHPRATANGLWMVEQALRAGTCGAVLTWMTGGDAGVLYRLQMAAGEGGSLGFIFRHDSFASQPSPAAIRLQLRKQQQRIQLEVLRRQNTTIIAPRVLKFSVNRLARRSHCSLLTSVKDRPFSFY